VLRQGELIAEIEDIKSDTEVIAVDENGDRYELDYGGFIDNEIRITIVGPIES
jgi:hypothetical protein